MEDTSFIYEPASPKTGSIIIDIIQTIVIALAITVVMYLFIVIPSEVDGQSMEKNFHDGELLFTNKLIQILGNSSIGDRFNYDYKRGDVIVFQKKDRDEPFIKRIIAGPGDVILFEDNNIIVNGKILNESYIPNSPEFKTGLPPVNISFLTEGEPRTVPEDKYFVMGDNRQNSQDSRFSSVGWIDRTEIKGKVFLRFWPLGNFGLISGGKFEETEYRDEL